MRNALPKHESGRREYLKVAEGGLYLEPTMVQTVLGSCLGAAFHVPSSGIGAFFHAFLPWYAEFEDKSASQAYRFVDTSIALVVKKFARLGVRPTQMTVSLIGGANWLVGERASVGARNVAAAYETLDRFGIRPEFADVGGRRGRKVFFQSATGELRIIRLRDALAQPTRPAG
jgi:chemotaxis protein CheD